MIVYTLALIVLCALAVGGLYVGVLIGKAVRDQFDELMPQRMVDYSGFVDVNASQD
jgi:hypothetical protein